MSFSPSIPNINDFCAISQKQILANFKAINDTWLINHVALTAVEDVGKHFALTLRPTTDPTTLVNQSAIYNKLVTSVPQLFYRPNSNATPIQLSNSNLNTLQTGAANNQQISFLAGPFTIYMGFQVAVGVTPITITLSAITTILYVGVSTVLPGPSNPEKRQGYNVAIATNVTGNQFTIRKTNNVSIPSSTVYYMAIGI